MVQEGAAAVAQSAAAKKKKNKNKNKKKTGGQAGAGASSSGQPQLVNTESEDRSRSSSETAPAVDHPAFAPAAVAESEPVENKIPSWPSCRHCCPQTAARTMYSTWRNRET